MGRRRREAEHPPTRRRAWRLVFVALAATGACSRAQDLGGDGLRDVEVDGGTGSGTFPSLRDGATRDVSARNFTALAVEAGAGFTCAIGMDGRVACWGTNLEGALGRAVAETRWSDVPTHVPQVTNVDDLAVGLSEVYAIRRPSGVTYWGTPGGLTTLGTWHEISEPKEFQGLSLAVGVAVGQAHACAITRGGWRDRRREPPAVLCWGQADRGQLGPGTAKASATAVSVRGIREPTAIRSRFANHTCVLHDGGKVACWGDNSYGQLGSPSPDASADAGKFSSEPISVPIDDAIALSAGDGTTCAVRKGGTILCWGHGTSGKLGGGDAGSLKGPVEVMGISDATDVSVSGGHVCAVRRGGEVACWGRNDRGQLGDGTRVDASQPVKVTGLARVFNVSAGMSHTCAVGGSVTGETEVWCWGSNDDGELGLGHHAEGEVSTVPAKVVGFADLTVER